MLSDKTLNLLLDLVEGQREAIAAVDDRGIAGVARFARDDLDPASAEVAILVADEWHHRGLARQLLRPLAERARKRGNQRFRAEIQADNTVARRFFLGLTPTARERHKTATWSRSSTWPNYFARWIDVGASQAGRASPRGKPAPSASAAQWRRPLATLRRCLTGCAAMR